MIFDKLENASFYEKIHPGFKTVFNFIQTTDLENFLPGKYNMEGKNLFVMISEYETQEASQTQPEAHRKYIDIQLLIAGIEKIGFAPYLQQKVKVNYSDENDIAFFESQVDYFELKPGHFTVFFPNELHQPGIAIGKPEKVKKVVFKIRA